jgi:resuscitation-promoting factor RpfA
MRAHGFQRMRLQVSRWLIALYLALPVIAFASCWEAVSAKYGIPVPLLKAVAEQESHFRNHAVRHEPDGTYSVCMMQIHSSNFRTIQRRFGIAEQHLKADECTCLDVGAWILYDNFQRLGPTWNAVGAYNAVSPEKRAAYAWSIYRRLEKFRALEQREKKDSKHD